MINFEQAQKLGKENLDATMQSFGAVSKGFQAIATEVADYSRKSFEEGSQAFEKLLGVKTLDKALELQSGYFKSAYEGYVAEATKIGEIYADIAKESYKPFEGLVASVTPRR